MSLSRLLSHDLPRSRVLAVVLALLVLGLAFAPFLFPGVKALNVAARCWCSWCWWPASTCCWATPAS
jgi:hypothetical protein